MEKEKKDEEEIFYDCLITLSQLEKEYHLPKGKLTMNKELMELVEKLAKAEFKKDKKQIIKNTAEVKETIDKIRNSSS